MKSKANQIIKVRAEMRRTFFYSVLLRLFSCLMILHAKTSSSTPARPTIKQPPTTTTPHHTNGKRGTPPHALTSQPHNITTSTDRHASTDSGRAAHPRPVWMASRPEPCALGASWTPSPVRECVRIYLQVLPYPHYTNGFQGGGWSRDR